MNVILWSVLVGFALMIIFAVFMAISDRKIIRQRAEEDRIKALEKESKSN